MKTDKKNVDSLLLNKNRIIKSHDNEFRLGEKREKNVTMFCEICNKKLGSKIGQNVLNEK